MAFKLTGTINGVERELSWDEAKGFSSDQDTLARLNDVIAAAAPVGLTPEGPFREPSAENRETALAACLATLETVSSAEGSLPEFEGGGAG